MRKKLFIFLLFMIVMPTLVFADMGAPMIKPYEAIVHNVEGADYYEYFYENENNRGYRKVGVLEYNTLIKVTYEDIINGEMYASFDINGKSGYILIEDIVPKYEEVVVDEKNESDFFYSLKEKLEVLVLKSDGIRMRKGPAKVYSVVGEVIPRGTKLEYQYCAGDECLWRYVEYNGVKGWIESLNAVVGNYTKESMLIPKEIDLIYDEEVVAKIPGNTFINEFYNVDDWSQKYYVTYNGKSGYINKYDVSVLHKNRTIKSKKVKKMYEFASVDSKILVDTIPENLEFQFIYSLGRRWDEWIYTTYDGKSGWIPFDEDEYFYNNIQNDESNDLENNNQENQNTENNILKEESDKTNDEIIQVNNSYTPKEIIFLSIISAIVISLTAIVTIVLINKRMKH